MKAFEIQQFGIENLALVERDEPQPSGKEVLVKLRATSLNYRDLMMVKGAYNPKQKLPLVPFSDGAGEIVAVGENVSRWKVGDRVCPIFMQGWIEGEITRETARTTLGGDLDGCLRELAAFDEEALVEIPEHLSFEEAATLPCAAVTAYHALFVSGCMTANDSVLLLGTGGVSIFALQFSSVYCERTIVTSSSDEKLERARSLGASDLINYKTREDWDRAVMELTGDRGVDHVVEVGGAGTMQRSLKSAKMGGHIAVIGVLAGAGEFNPNLIFARSLKLHGIFVGSRKMFEDMNRLIAFHHLHPVIDKVFEFEETREALKLLESGSHFGKIVIRI